MPPFRRYLFRAVTSRDASAYLRFVPIIMYGILQKKAKLSASPPPNECTGGTRAGRRYCHMVASTGPFNCMSNNLQTIAYLPPPSTLFMISILYHTRLTLDTVTYRIVESCRPEKMPYGSKYGHLELYVKQSTNKQSLLTTSFDNIYDFNTTVPHTTDSGYCHIVLLNRNRERGGDGPKKKKRRRVQEQPRSVNRILLCGNLVIHQRVTDCFEL